jgi:hypothetical protein
MAKDEKEQFNQSTKTKATPSAVPEGPLAYNPPTTAILSEAREVMFSRAFRDIVKARFDFPTKTHADFKTYVNYPERTMGVRMSGGDVAYPDVVVVQHPQNFTKIVAQIETNETISEATARHEWRPYSELAPLYVYVPVGKGDEALSLCRRYGVQLVGVRTWRYMVGYDDIEINDRYTASDGLEELLPRMLRPA